MMTNEVKGLRLLADKAFAIYDEITLKQDRRRGEDRMRHLAQILFACVISTGAYAQDSTIAKEITGYRDIN